MPDDVFATPRIVKLEDCQFYHFIDLLGIGLVGNSWDLRRGVDQYLGHVDFAGKRVLEIGPASGFLTIEMGKRGADVVAVELPSFPGWDCVPCEAPRWQGFSSRLHVWTAPRWQGLSSRLQLGRCSHVLGLRGRHSWPLAIMPSADQVPVKSSHSAMRWH